jgi:hypothetical protein
LLRFGICAISLFVLSACTQKSLPPEAPSTLTVSLLPQQMPSLRAPLLKAFSGAQPAVDVRFVEQSFGIEYSRALQSGKADIAFFYSDTAYLAFAGELDGRRYDQLRGVAELDPVPLYILVRGGSSIHTIDDLRGQRVSLGAPGSSTALTGGIALEALGITATKSYEPYAEAGAKLSAGTLDAVFAIGNYPPNRFQDVLRHGARVLSLSEPIVARLHRRHPFVRGIAIPRLEAGDRPTLAIAVDRLLVCRKDLDERIVYEITKAFFKALPDLSLVYPPLRHMNAEDAPATLIPLHEGAARYYREQAGL